MFDKRIDLIVRTYTTDSLGQYVPTDTLRPIWAKKTSVGGSEFFRAGETGIKPQFKIRTPKQNYNGEELVKVDGKIYAVYRTYETDGVFELYCHEKAGD